MRKQTIQYLSPLDALIEIAKRLSILESQHHMDSEEFFYRYSQGKMSDDADLSNGPTTIDTTCICIRNWM